MNEFPTPEQLRAHARHARKMADEFRAEGDHYSANRQEAVAEFNEIQADAEEEMRKNKP